MRFQKIYIPINYSFYKTLRTSSSAYEIQPVSYFENQSIKYHVTSLDASR